jgi:hypothetical protein
MDMLEGVGRRQEDTGVLVDVGTRSLNGRERNVLFRNDGDGTFVDVGWVNAADRIEDGRGLAVWDYDRDGRLDLLLRNFLQPAQLLRNTGPARRWLQLRLIGIRSNRDAVGARLRVEAGGLSQTSLVNAGSGYLSARSLVQHFGLGDAPVAERVTIVWPSGHVSTLRDLPSGRRYTVIEGRDVAEPFPAEPFPG